MARRLAHTVPEAAALLGCSPSHVRRAVRRGVLPVVDPALAGRRVLIPASALEREVEGLAIHRASATAAGGSGAAVAVPAALGGARPTASPPGRPTPGASTP